MNFYDALKKLRPNSGWTLSTTRYEDIIWQDANTTKPSIEEINNTIIELKAAEPMRLLRIERDRKLTEVDWWTSRALDGTPLTTEQTAYRQALRDLPALSEPQLDENGQLTNVTWPEVPE